MRQARLPLALVVFVAVTIAESALLACPVCFEADDSATAHGIRAAVLVLFAVTTTVLGACGVFVARFASRARREIEASPPLSPKSEVGN